MLCVDTNGINQPCPTWLNNEGQDGSKLGDLNDENSGRRWPK
jgi:hypothetical protein